MGAHHFGVAVGAHAQTQATGTDGVQLRTFKGIEVLLAHVDAVCTCINGSLPVVVDKQACVGALHGCHSGLHFAANGCLVIAFEAQLHRGHTCAGHASHPFSSG